MRNLRMDFLNFYQKINKIGCRAVKGWVLKVTKIFSVKSQHKVVYENLKLRTREN